MSNHPYDEKTIARFWAKVNKNGPIHPYNPKLGKCWVWTAATYTSGYGSLSVGGTRAESTHRISYALHNGPIPTGKLVCHSCDRRQCVNPQHLWLGCHKDNTDDAVSKGRLLSPPEMGVGESTRFRPGDDRIPHGEDHHSAKLSESDVAQIRKMHSGKRGEYSILGVQFGVHADTIRLIVKRKTWKHVP